MSFRKIVDAIDDVSFDVIQAPYRQSRILVVDDELLMAQMVRLQLQSAGFENVSVMDQTSLVLDIMRSDVPEVVLLDLCMPEVDGLEILKAIRATDLLAQTTVIMMTASTDYGEKIRALELGATDFLNKPVHPAELVIRIRNILKAKAYEEQLRENERRKRLDAEQELRTAERIQSHLFPSKAPRIPRIDIAGRAYSAGNGCGDYFDFFKLSDNHVGLVIGDVTGHGMPSALRMVETRAYLRSLVKSSADPGKLLTQLNQFMIREAAYGDGTEQFMTMFLAKLDPVTHEVIYAAAGHTGYVVRQSGDTHKLKSGGFPLGIFELPYETSSPVHMAAGDTLIVTTDGIEESMNPEGEQFGITRLLSVVRSNQGAPATAIVSRLHQAVEDFSAGLKQRDDITVLVAVIKPDEDVSSPTICAVG